MYKYRIWLAVLPLALAAGLVFWQWVPAQKSLESLSLNLPDLIIADLDVSKGFSTSVLNGNVFRFSFTVKNIGQASAYVPPDTAFFLYYENTKPESAIGGLIIGESGTFSLNPNEAKEFKDQTIASRNFNTPQSLKLVDRIKAVAEARMNDRIKFIMIVDDQDPVARASGVSGSPYRKVQESNESNNFLEKTFPIFPVEIYPNFL